MDSLAKNLLSASEEFLWRLRDGLIERNVPLLVALTVLGLLLLINTIEWDLRQCLLRFLRWCPGLNYLVQLKINKALADVHESIHKNSRVVYETSLPAHGLSSDKVVQKLRKYKASEYIRWNEGFASGSVYPKDSTLADLSSRVFKEFIWTNPLHPDLFPDVRRMEAEVVRMCLSMFHGDGDACGTMTSGGTESIMLACLAYRERARAKGIRNPAIVLAESAHPAFDKAAHYFDLDVVHVPVDPISCKADVAAMRSAITGSTCMIVASAPGFPHGIIDPVRELASLGSRYGIPVHVDCCLGGFLLPFMEAADCELEPFDFRLPGVTSISCDTHKYGFAAKGTSVIMYRNKHYRSKQYFTQPNWPGGVYASATFAGSRSGALIAVCWATMMYFGRQGYTDSTRRIVKTTQFIASELRKIPGIVVYGDPQVCVVAFGSDRFDIYRLAQGLSELPNGRGWCLNALQFPPALHLCVTDLHTVEGRAEGFIRDVSTVAAELYDHPENYSGGAAALYGACATIPDRSIISEVAVGYLDACYDTPSPKTEETKRKE
ncbi:Sphingosine-1-phosphate lyase 1, variant 2 [Clonorchis sinensis]|uniref:sphinganine-1-phosphate aldolase n=1 Tax=Clonorchis sinensis TaxID=79923 RepID=A0A8T1M046_CLOSI|nr:Sphingosine-1-phosphate lyase 1 [Clonorchis sinensis]KAG5442728.1 Sphingosine-1-phosphate lyase 1, variant 2 [Clonorchis sinensis]